MLGCRGLCWAYAVHFTAHVSSPLGDDMINLLFHFLDEFLFLMCDDPYFIVKVLKKKKGYLPGKLSIVGNKLLSTLGSLWCKTYKGWVLSPLTPRRDQNETSPYKILTLSNKQVMRMFKLIRYKLLSWSNIKFL